MSLTGKLDKMVKNMRWYDIFLVKMTVFFATLFLISVWEGFRNFVLSVQGYWYLIITIILMIPLCKKMFFD
ncbi:MAG: hypothetical protein AABW92_03385 [Nanoarchaeota archaeon]